VQTFLESIKTVNNYAAERPKKRKRKRKMKKQTYQVLDETAVLRTEPDGSTVVEVRYIVSMQEKCFRRYFSEHLDFESRTYLTEKWWAERSADPYPMSNERAIDIINGRGIAETEQITVEYVAAFYRITNCILGSIPPCADKIESW